VKWRDSLILYPCHVVDYLFYRSSLRQPISAAVTHWDTQSEFEQRGRLLEVNGWVSVLGGKEVCVVRRG
jgi:hypothetical protein